MATLEIVRDMLAKKLFSTEKDALLFVCFKAKINGAQSGFNMSEAMCMDILLNNIPTIANKVYDQYKKFKSTIEVEQEYQM